jgi:hypothetical protein
MWLGLTSKMLTTSHDDKKMKLSYPVQIIIINQDKDLENMIKKVTRRNNNTPPKHQHRQMLSQQKDHD